ncbi:beta-tubulin cofactor d [Hirsutella rhossiliensis]|uniref:Beta-tubulin cofactor d n=1 Tax=Hirsutella rhossiliensis TaxID=111463 RepID=A0A9P8N3A0_9HYPO|nr:beta-tubulin cofactor d [Hirsutella rhossiliensis]KAH0965827.1 beta-tubulin cofactor d [Hirsutella rhossiliensis]
MDAPDADSDVKLQKASAELIADLDRALRGFVRKPDAQGKPRVRSFVRAKETLQATTTVLDLFQELPQLLDPHLPRWIPLLADAYLEYRQTRRGGKHGAAPTSSRAVVPLDQAICRVLYAISKVRGEKVVVRFLSNETRFLELLLAAVEEAQGEQSRGPGWEWEQRYVVLLWLSHLLLAPFDLSTISSVDLDHAGLPVIPGLAWPENLPGITLRLMPLAVGYLSSPGKEKDAAKALLVRIAMRRDMQQLGVLDCLVRWALASLKPPPDTALQTTFFYLGVLSFLAGLLRSAAETSDLDEYLPLIFHTVYDITLGESRLSKALVTLALVRKMILKVIRSVVVSLLRKSRRDMASTELTETAIGYLLESLSDNDTPVRLSASKSLSIITLKLDPGMASQVVEAVLEALNRNILWTRPTGGPAAKAVRDLSAVSHLEWHGLMLTLSHLLYRRSPPAGQLSDILHALLVGLSFEQRSTSGVSVGANVRDAACFGIWATARRYTSQELLAVSSESVFAAKAHPASASILQVLATELVVTAALDPAGNIRRGASAALQELVGRHPDTVEQGIAVVQTVDYHAVARRSRAVDEVAVGVARLSPQYAEALMDGILGWRGIGDADAPSRRVVGRAFGALTAELSRTNPAGPVARFEWSVRRLMQQMQSLAKRQVEERHGLLSCFASMMDHLTLVFRNDDTHNWELVSMDAALMRNVLSNTTEILADCHSVSCRKPEMVAEGASRLVISLLPFVQATALPNVSHALSQTGKDLLSPSRSGRLIELVSAFDVNPSRKAEVEALLSKLRDVIPAWLDRNETETVEPASAAALMLLVLSESGERERLLRGWAEVVRHKPTSRAAATGHGYFHALALARPLADLYGRGSRGIDVACGALIERWHEDGEVATRVALLVSLTRGRVIQAEPARFLELLRDGLGDYTTDARGDVGSHVRVEALRATRCLWERLGDGRLGDGRLGEDEWVATSVKTLLHRVLRLSAEKLDRVRPEAQAAVALALQESHASRFGTLGFSSKGYFETLLDIVSTQRLHPWLPQPDAEACMAELLAGFVTSADTGNDDLVMASRAALTEFCEASRANGGLVCRGLLRNLRERQGEERVVVPTLEISAFLFHCGLFGRDDGASLRELCRQTQRAGYRSGNVRKLLACVKVYGGVACTEARRRLGALLFHPWPRVRSAVVDELWGVLGDEDDGTTAAGGRGRARLLGVDWAKADKQTIRGVVEELGPGS